MISVGDGRKGLGLGFGGGREMDENELEEGEACSYRNDNDDYDASIDPDVALSYIVRAFFFSFFFHVFLLRQVSYMFCFVFFF
jgi:hypothetical protein